MKSTFELLHGNLFGQKLARPTSKRAYILSLILDELKKEGNNSKPAYVAYRLSHLRVPDLEYTYSMAKDYRERTGKPFGKYLFGSIKAENNFKK